MGIISKPNTHAPNTVVSSSKLNANEDTVYNAFNGNIEAANLATGAVTTAKIADSNVTTAKIADSNVTTAKIADANVTSEKLDATIACRAYRSAAFTINADAKIVLDTENFDLGSDFATGTFTAPLTGYYQVNAMVGTTNIGDGQQVLARLYANGAAVALATGAGSAAGSDPKICIADIVFLSAGQTLELWAEGSTSITGATGSTSTYMSVSFIGT